MFLGGILKRLLLVIAFQGLGIVSVSGQACCSGGSPVSGLMGITSAESRSFQLMATYDQHFMNRLYNEDELLEIDDRRRRIHSLVLEGSYGLTKRLSISGMATFIRQSRTINTFNNANHTTLNGVGDAFLLFKYQLLNTKKRHPTQVTVGAGPKLPLGKNDVRQDNGVLLSPDLQPGTGSWDILTWGYAARQNFLKSGINVSAYINYRITTPTTRADSELPYQYGNELQVNLGASKTIGLGKAIFDPSLYVVYRNLAADQVDEEILTNTGGQWLYLKPGITWQININTSLTLATDIPVYQRLNGTQLGSTYKGQLALNYSF